ncbi:alpha-L-glutamate ligase [Azospirillum sp. TSH100]|uniref:ATP-grasp domain-containing protein n=1 Tax=Azospirillum sp. TSH100 TaxID=652764 RepID=UPI000D60521F|nr:RimK family alpha-L-glutamate ligase [Azospirillum sp. TSH100]PWC87449.1 alpha-L-glutamate ligase [Azospirillum sp. TSH100]QCG89755.1 RimK family alpha-L-glutamate ligase [Azospirillum sp. TSH100]
MGRTRIAIFVDGADWHTRRLTGALACRGAKAVPVSLSACGFGPDGPLIPGFDGGLPDACLVRTISAGSFEQVTLRLGVLHALVHGGVPVANNPASIERCVDKSATAFRLAAAGVPTPRTWTVADPVQASTILADLHADGRAAVLKPLFGSQGKGLRRLDPGMTLPGPEEVAGTYHLQEYVGAADGGWFDWRVFVVDGRPLAAMVRQGDHWITNVKQGARCHPASPGGVLGDLAVAAAAAVGTDYAGVDVIRAPDGRFLVLEVNSMPAWRGLQAVTPVDVAQALADLVLDRLASASPMSADARRVG